MKLEELHEQSRQLQARQSLLMHVEAVRMLRADPPLAVRVLATLERWMLTCDPRSLPLFEQWRRIIEQGDWAAALSEDELGYQLRQASPLSTLLPNDIRLRIITLIASLRRQAKAEFEAEASRGNHGD